MEQKLEFRYLVLKMKDVAMLTDTERSILECICDKLCDIREKRGVNPDLSCIIIEDDWPEYSTIVASILKRSMDEQSQI